LEVQVLNYIGDQANRSGLQEQEQNPGLLTLVEHPPAGIADRRTASRFPLRLAIRCRGIGPFQSLDPITLGESLNVSSKGLLFSSSHVFLPGQVIEVFIEWPILLENRIRLTLVAEGIVVRSAGTHTAVSVKKYQFKTRGSTDFLVSPVD
jgi:hypothetical protein